MRSNIARTCGSSRVPGARPARLACERRYWFPRRGAAPRNVDQRVELVRRVCCRSANDGIGAVGLTSVRAIACAGSRDAMSVRFGPGPSLPFSPILWHARQPDWPTTSLPFSYCAAPCRPARRCARASACRSASAARRRRRGRSGSPSPRSRTGRPASRSAAARAAAPGRGRRTAAGTAGSCRSSGCRSSRAAPAPAA